MIDLQKLSQEAKEASITASTVEELSKVQNQYLGKKSELVKAKKGLGSIPESDRATAGKELNEARESIEIIFTERKL